MPAMAELMTRSLKKTHTKLAMNHARWALAVAFAALIAVVAALQWSDRGSTGHTDANERRVGRTPGADDADVGLKTPRTVIADHRESVVESPVTDTPDIGASSDSAPSGTTGGRILVVTPSGDPVAGIQVCIVSQGKREYTIWSGVTEGPEGAAPIEFDERARVAAESTLVALIGGRFDSSSGVTLPGDLESIQGDYVLTLNPEFGSIDVHLVDPTKAFDLSASSIMLRRGSDESILRRHRIARAVPDSTDASTWRFPVVDLNEVFTISAVPLFGPIVTRVIDGPTETGQTRTVEIELEPAYGSWQFTAIAPDGSPYGDSTTLQGKLQNDKEGNAPAPSRVFPRSIGDARFGFADYSGRDADVACTIDLEARAVNDPTSVARKTIRSSFPRPGEVVDLGRIVFEQAAAQVRGRVVDGEGKPVENASVFMRWTDGIAQDDPQDWPGVSWTNPGPDGQFAFAQFPSAGAVAILATTVGGATQSVPRFISGPTSDVTLVLENVPQLHLRFRLHESISDTAKLSIGQTPTEENPYGLAYESPLRRSKSDPELWNATVSMTSDEPFQLSVLRGVMGPSVFDLPGEFMGSQAVDGRLEPPVIDLTNELRELTARIIDSSGSDIPLARVAIGKTGYAVREGRFRAVVTKEGLGLDATIAAAGHGVVQIPVRSLAGEVVLPAGIPVVVELTSPIPKDVDVDSLWFSLELQGAAWANAEIEFESVTFARTVGETLSTHESLDASGTLSFLAPAPGKYSLVCNVRKGKHYQVAWLEHSHHMDSLTFETIVVPDGSLPVPFRVGATSRASSK